MRRLDLGSLTSIRGFVNETKPLIHGLICNAGVQYAGKTRYTSDGFEETFGVNHLGHFLLANLLTAKYAELKKIAVVSSGLHNPAGKGSFAPPNYTTPEEMAHPADTPDANLSKLGMCRYATSKLCNIFFTYELSRRRPDIMINAFNPGLLPGTGLGRNNSPMMKFAWYIMLPVFAGFIPGSCTTDKAGLALSKLITDVPASGKYFDRGMDAPSSGESYDTLKAKELWDESARLTGFQITAT